jgi:hypothetical protein
MIGRRKGILGAIITCGAFPFSVSAAMAVAVIAIERGWNVGITLAGISAFTVVLVAILERVHPEYPGWNRSRGDMRVDALHAVV